MVFIDTVEMNQLNSANISGNLSRNFSLRILDDLAGPHRSSSSAFFGFPHRDMNFDLNFLPRVKYESPNEFKARAEAQRLGVWLMVNIQNVREFACQALNRDVWSNAAVKELLRSNFLFWQIYHDSADGNRIGNYYRITTYPAIFVVDPRTGELLTQFRAQDAVSFCDQVTTFLDTFPDFAARDRHLIDGSGKSASNSGHRKRTFLASQDEEDSRDEEAKKSEDMPDVDAVVSKVSKATTVDKDEWRNYLGEADGKGRKVSLMLRFPDGDRQTIEVEDTTPLRALFMLTAGRGFSPCEHILVLSYPKREYSFEDADRSLRELQLNKRELIHIESK
uniref:UBX domain-containing protein n=1 Tax=Parascaris equorum TaxID=6256 RepID=A0A914RWX8_PAREQ